MRTTRHRFHIGAMLLLGCVAAATPAWAEDLYVSQSGTGSGTSCTSPRSSSWFNTASNWANPKQDGKIEASVVEPRLELRALPFADAQLHEGIALLHAAA